MVTYPSGEAAAARRPASKAWLEALEVLHPTSAEVGKPLPLARIAHLIFIVAMCMLLIELIFYLRHVHVSY